MGGVTGGSPLLTIEPDVYVLQSSSWVVSGWTRLGRMATPRALAGSAKVGNSVYIVGGTMYDTTGVLRTTDLVERMDYTISNGSSNWVTLAPLPYPSMGSRCETVGRVIYCVLQPPQNASGKSGHAGQLLRYNLPSNTWTRLADLPQPVISAALTASHSTLYLVGGNLDGRQGTGVASAWAYSIATDTWSTLPSMTTPRSRHQLALLNGTLVAVGGVDINNNVPPYADVLSLMGGEWHQATLPGFHLLTNTAFVTLDASQSLAAGGLATFGGIGGSYFVSSLQVFDWAANATHSPPAMPVRMRDAMVVVL